jgi:hypothetical protein
MTSDTAALRSVEKFNGASVHGGNLAVGDFVCSDQGLLSNQRG